MGPGDQGPPAGSGTQAHWQELLGDSRGQRRSTRHAEATTQSRPAVGGSAPAIRGNPGPEDRWGVWQLISSDGEVPEEDTYTVTNPTAVIHYNGRWKSKTTIPMTEVHARHFILHWKMPL